MALVDRLRDAPLSAAERRVAQVMIDDLEAVAFGTVAEIAAAAGTGRATVMRLAAKAGFAGFADLQSTVRAEVTRRLRPAAVRVRRSASTAADPVERALDIETANLASTLGAVDRRVLARSTDALARADRVAVLAGDAATGAARDFTVQLGMVRPDVVEVTGGPTGLLRGLAWLRPKDVAVVIDVARYEASLLEVIATARAAGVPVLVVTDSPLSPLADGATWSFACAADGSGPFDSYVGVLALLNLLVVTTLERRRAAATSHLDALEQAWTDLGALRDE